MAENQRQEFVKERFQEKSKKTHFQPRKKERNKERNQVIGQEKKKQVLRSYFFSFNTHLNIETIGLEEKKQSFLKTM